MSIWLYRYLHKFIALLTLEENEVDGSLTIGDTFLQNEDIPSPHTTQGTVTVTFQCNV